MKLFRSHLIRYLIIGGTNTLISLLIYYLLLKLGVYYLINSVICFIIGVLLGYTMNALFVFHNPINFYALTKYISVYCISLLINLILLYSFVEIAGINKMLAQILTIMLVTIINYFLVKRLVFIKRII